ncbi:SAM-dependent methyltransferase [Pseudonocardia sulfidoxydans]|uniref:SAM-dependent methyltransferase n=1 Tax=Pseudonocardia sulfidoxydans TaxID=54011 RepID=UPI0011BEB1E8|nr:SAM-dependent methyltransferase [Pseudonocardia sulfidoxydans]
MNDRPAGGTGTSQDDPVAPDLSRPSIARVYDYVLGGKQHFEIDRRAAQGFIDALPDAPVIAKDNRNLLRRGVRFLVEEAGIRQILDIGSGLPTEGNVHELAHAIDPSTRVVYVDNDPGVLAHGRALLAGDATTAVITADLRTPAAILADPVVTGLLDLSRPYALLLSGIVQHLADDEDPYGIVGTLREALPAGAYMLLSHFLDDDEPRATTLERGFLQGGLGTGRFRRWDEIRRFFDGLEMVEPGLVYANDWRPDAGTPAESPVHTLYAGGVGRKV